MLLIAGGLEKIKWSTAIVTDSSLFSKLLPQTIVESKPSNHDYGDSIYIWNPISFSTY